MLDDKGRPVLDGEARPRMRVETWPIRTDCYVGAFTELTSRENDPSCTPA